MKVYILGICGTFMGGVAALAKEMGHKVAGCDENVYPPMSTQLESLGIELDSGWQAEQLPTDADAYIVGNVVSRGNPAIEAVMNKRLPYCSGPEWLGRELLRDQHVIAIAGTHGKTSTSSMVAWVLEQAGLNPGFLIGGVAQDFGVSARLGGGQYFVVEADEYDTAFFDKRSKFVHYYADTAVLNNLEYDHADIFDDIEAIKRQFHIFVRTVPGNGRVVNQLDDANLGDVLNRGCWSEQQSISATNVAADWSARLLQTDGSEFEVLRAGNVKATVRWGQLGEHNVNNALAAIAAADHVGIAVEKAAAALSQFQGIKRRLELRGEVDGNRVYDDFAHHPTEIATTLAGLRSKVAGEQIIAVLEPRSNSMRMGAHSAALAEALRLADEIYCYAPKDIDWDLAGALQPIDDKCHIYSDFDRLLSVLGDRAEETKAQSHFLIMSNGGFQGIHQRLLDLLAKQ